MVPLFQSNARILKRISHFSFLNQSFKDFAEIWIAGIGDGTWGGFAPTQNLVDAYEMTNGKPITDPASGYDAQNPYLNRDSRLDKTVLHNGSSWKGVTIQTYEGGNANSSSNNDRSRTSYGLKKFLDQSLVTATQVYQGQDNNWIFYRYADVLLPACGIVRSRHNCLKLTPLLVRSSLSCPLQFTIYLFFHLSNRFIPLVNNQEKNFVCPPSIIFCLQYS